MSAYAVIRGERTGDWAVVAEDGDMLLYPPRTWNDYGDAPGYLRGLAYFPASGVALMRTPFVLFRLSIRLPVRVAWWRARWIVARREFAARREAAREARARQFLTARSEKTP